MSFPHNCDGGPSLEEKMVNQDELTLCVAAHDTDREELKGTLPAKNSAKKGKAITPKKMT